MKRKLLRLPVLVCTVALLSACSSVNKMPLERDSNSKNARERNVACFIQKADGSIQHFSSLKLVTGIFTTPYLLADGKTKIIAAEIEAYQNADHYAVSPEKLANGRKSKVAVEALPGFAVRIAKGALNIYCKKYFNGAKAVDELYVQMGDDGKIEAYSAERMAALVKSNPAAADIFNSKKKAMSLTQKLQAVADVYNAGELISKN